MTCLSISGILEGIEDFLERNYLLRLAIDRLPDDTIRLKAIGFTMHSLASLSFLLTPFPSFC